MIRRNLESTPATLLFLAALLLASQAAVHVPLPDPVAMTATASLLPPDTPGHPWGTDELGRDVLSRVIHGLSATLLVSVVALVTALGIGAVVGGLAGYFAGRSIDTAVNWLIDLILSLPFLLVMAAILSVTSPGLGNAYTVLAGIMWVHPARIVRAEVARRRNLGYILAARALGVTELRIFFRKLLPSAVRPAVLLSVSYLPEIVALEAGLSFVGLGAQPPEPGLGKMIFDGLPYVHSAWWLTVCPAITLFVVVLTINAIALAGAGTAKSQSRRP